MIARRPGHLPPTRLRRNRWRENDRYRHPAEGRRRLYACRPDGRTGLHPIAGSVLGCCSPRTSYAASRKHRCAIRWRRPESNQIWPWSCSPSGSGRHPYVPGTSGETAPPSRPWKAARAPASKLAVLHAQAARAIECRSLPAGRSVGRFQPSIPPMDRDQSWTQYSVIIVPDDRFRIPEGYKFFD